VLFLASANSDQSSLQIEGNLRYAFSSFEEDAYRINKAAVEM
jgi:hypothetical protein